MLAAFIEMNESLREVNVSGMLMCRIYNPDLLRTLMQRTGTGERFSVRQLANAADVSAGTIGALITGTQQLIPLEKAHRITTAIGVDLLVCFVPAQRAARRRGSENSDEAVPA